MLYTTADPNMTKIHDKNLKKAYISSETAENKFNSKKLWRVLRELVPKRCNDESLSQVIAGKSDPLEIAEALNSHFIF